MGPRERPVVCWCSINIELKDIYSLFYTSLCYLKFLFLSNYFFSLCWFTRCTVLKHLRLKRTAFFCESNKGRISVLILADFYFCLNWFTCRGEMVMTLSFKTFQNKTCTIKIKHFFFEKLPFFSFFFYIHVGPTTLSDLGQIPWTRIIMLMFTYANNQQLIKFE